VEGRPLTVLENPTAQQIIGLLLRSPDQTVKGLIIGDDLFFWSATNVATHGHVAEHLWPTEAGKNY
jgi:hypothetical protein